MIFDVDNPLAIDLDHILEHTADYFEDLRGQKIFISGGTGFIGSWLLESFIWANRKLALNATAVVLTRNAALCETKIPALVKHPEIEFLTGDIRSFIFPAGAFRHIIHAATESSAMLNEQQPELMLETIAEGMQRILKFAALTGCQNFLFTSSGAVYGSQPSTISHTPETYSGGPDPLHPSSAYAEGKRLAELLGAIAARQHGIAVKIARCYSFVGPYLPLDRHFAIGNFIRDGLNGAPLAINGDGTPLRSYLYASDLMIWLWTILFKGQSLRAYNVGSEESRSIRGIAEAVRAELMTSPAIEIAQPANPNLAISRYVPSTRRAREELGLTQTVSLPVAIAKTIAWHQASHKWIG